MPMSTGVSTPQSTASAFHFGGWGMLWGVAIGVDTNANPPADHVEISFHQHFLRGTLHALGWIFPDANAIWFCSIRERAAPSGLVPWDSDGRSRVTSSARRSCLGRLACAFVWRVPQLAAESLNLSVQRTAQHLVGCAVGCAVRWIERFGDFYHVTLLLKVSGLLPDGLPLFLPL